MMRYTRRGGSRRSPPGQIARPRLRLRLRHQAYSASLLARFPGSDRHSRIGLRITLQKVKAVRFGLRLYGARGALRCKLGLQCGHAQALCLSLLALALR
jgi:hypothetical protein